VRQIGSSMDMKADLRELTAVCTENLIRIDCVTESPKRQRR